MILCKFVLFDGYFLLKVIVSFAIVLIFDLSILDLPMVAVELLLTIHYLGIEFFLIGLEGLLEVLPLGSGGL
jgi:hypothetical protein